MLFLISAALAGGLLGEHAVVSEAICAATNPVRAAHDLHTLPTWPTLHEAAQLHADQMVKHDFFGHTAPPQARWTTPVDRLVAAGLLTTRTPAENIATWYAMNYQPGDGYRVIDPATYRYRTQGRALLRHTPESFAAALVAYWMDSPGHRANILAEAAGSVGCAASMYLNHGFPMYKAVQVFLPG